MPMLGRLALMGGGVMGESILKRLLALRLIEASAVSVAEISPSRRDYLQQNYKIACTPEAAEAARNTDTVLLAVKPQNLPELMDELRGHLGPEQLALSIIAGATLSTMTAGLQHQAVVRVMPNTPAQIGQGMSVWTATPQVTPAQREAAQAILSAMGREIFVAEEKYLDMATALSGSGPAYVFLFIEALIDAGVHIGMPREMAELLALQTVVGSALFAQESGLHPAQLRNMVTSPGGTTTEAVFQLEQGAFRGLLMQAVQAAYQKSRALGQAGDK